MSPDRSAAVVTVSDRASEGARHDESGDLAEELLRRNGFDVLSRHLVSDEFDQISAVLRSLVNDGVSFVVTTGGTGLAQRDVTPEATRRVIEREAPGIAEMMRLEGLKKTPHAALSRALAGTAGETLIVNLPGSVKAVRESLEALLPIIPHALDILAGHTEHHGHD